MSLSRRNTFAAEAEAEMAPLMASDGDGAQQQADAVSSASSGTDAAIVQIKVPKEDVEPLPSPSKEKTPSSPRKEKGTSQGARRALVACMMYSCCSIGMVLLNKSLASSYNHLMEGGKNLNVLLVVFQAIVSVFSAEVCKASNLVEYPAFTFRTACQWAPVNIFFCGMLFTGMASLQYNSVPMVTVFKNVTNIIITIGDFYFFKAKVEKLAMLAFAVMLGGAVAAAWNDITISAIGLFWMCSNCCATAGYVLYMKFATQTIDMSKFGMVFYNNILCTAFLLPVATARGETALFLDTNALHTLDYFAKNFIAGSVGFFLNFASLNCVSVTGPTTYAIVGSLNKVPIAVLGYFLFSSVISPETWFFIAVNICGGFIYSYAKIQTSRRKV